MWRFNWIFSVYNCFTIFPDYSKVWKVWWKDQDARNIFGIYANSGKPYRFASPQPEYLTPDAQLRTIYSLGTIKSLVYHPIQIKNAMRIQDAIILNVIFLLHDVTGFKVINQSISFWSKTDLCLPCTEVFLCNVSGLAFVNGFPRTTKRDWKLKAAVRSKIN